MRPAIPHPRTPVFDPNVTCASTMSERTRRCWRRACRRADARGRPKPNVSVLTRTPARTATRGQELAPRCRRRRCAPRRPIPPCARDRRPPTTIQARHADRRHRRAPAVPARVPRRPVVSNFGWREVPNGHAGRGTCRPPSRRRRVDVVAGLAQELASSRSLALPAHSTDGSDTAHQLHGGADGHTADEGLHERERRHGG